MFHLLSEPLLGGMTGISGEEAITQLAQTWLRGMRPEQ